MHENMKLGKQPARIDLRTLKLSAYLPGALPFAPVSVDYSHGIKDWGMMLNDVLGCCTIAAVAHAVQAWSSNAAGKELTVPDTAVRDYYAKWDGYNPSDPLTDRGGVEIDVLNNFRQDGFAGVTLDAYTSINRSNPAEVKTGIWMFGGAYIGVELPIRAQNQTVWDVAGSGPLDAPQSWGGHAIYVVAYDDKTLTCITWGELKKMTWRWFAKYCSEAYALISPSWLKTSGVAPSGFDMPTLLSDLKLVTA